MIKVVTKTGDEIMCEEVKRIYETGPPLFKEISTPAELPRKLPTTEHDRMAVVHKINEIITYLRDQSK